MLTFVFTAKNAETGESIKAEVQAENEQAAAKLLIGRNLFPVTIEEKGTAGKVLKSRAKRVKTKERILFTRQLSTLVSAGLPILQSLRSVQDQVSSSAMKVIAAEIISDVEGGSSLAAAFAKHPKAFNQTFVSLVAAGETSGSLDKTLDRIAFQMEKDAQVYSKIRGALVYPAIVLAVTILVMAFLLTVVLPQVGQVYKDFGKELPFITKGMIAVAGAVTSFWWLFILALAGGIYMLRHYVETVSGRRVIDGLKLKAPVFGKLMQKVYMTRFCRTLATLLASGVPMLNALDITRKTINNQVIADSMDQVITDVRGGKALSLTLHNDPYFMKVVPQMVKIGEDSGAIDSVLEKLANYFDGEIDEAVKALSSSVEPALMVLMGAMVGLIMVAVLLPIYGLVQTGIT